MLLGIETAALRIWATSPYVSSPGNVLVLRYISSTNSIARCHTTRFLSLEFKRASFHSRIGSTVKSLVGWRFRADNPRPDTYLPGSKTNRCALSFSTASGEKGSVNVVPSYQAFH